MTTNEFKDWALAQGSVAKYNDGKFKGECVSLINQYCWRVLNVPAGAWGNAKDWGTNSPQKQYFNILPANTGLRAGDILVYGSSFGGGFGHIEIALSPTQALFQNRNFDGRVGVGGILGGYYAVLRVKGGNDVTDLDSARILSRYLLGRRNSLSGADDPDLRNHHVGKDANAKIKEFFHSAEGKAFQAYQDGAFSFYERYKNTIGELSERPSKAELQAALAKVDKFSSEVGELQKALETERAKPPKEVEKIVEKPVEVPADYSKGSIGDLFIALIKKLLAKFNIKNVGSD